MRISRPESKVFLIALLFVIFLLNAERGVIAESKGFVLEAEKHWDTWETYGLGGTCNPGSQNLCLADVDDDGITEIITGGFAYEMANGSRTSYTAPLKIWNWNGQNITLEKSHKWAGNIGCVYAADVNYDNIIEIITVGTVLNDTGIYSSLRIWHWNGEELTLKASREGTPASSIFVGDLDKDNIPEIITVGRVYAGNQSGVQLCIWHLEENGLILKRSHSLSAANVTTANSVCAYNLDNEGEVEIITGGYANGLKESNGQLCIWHWNGQDLTLKANEKWQIVGGVYALNTAGSVQGNTVVNNLKVGDVDGDGTPEIITGGFAYDGERVNAQLKIWSWNGSILTQERSQEWTTDYLTEVKGMSLDDVDGDSHIEIIQSGVVAAKGSFAENATSPERAQLRVWSWDGTDLTLEHSEEWVIGEGVCAWNEAAGDVDRDGITEIVTVGCMYVGDLCDPDLRVWSVEREAVFPLYEVLAIVGIGAAVVLTTAFYFAKKRH